MGWSLVCAVASGLAVLAWRAGPASRLPRSLPPGRARPVDAARRSRLVAAAATGASALVLVVGLGWWGLPVAAGVGAASYVVLGRLRSAEAERRGQQVRAALPQACDLLSVCLESGLPLRHAAEVVADALGGVLGAELAEVDAKVRLGVDEAAAWAELGRADPVLDALGREVARTVGSGVAVSRSLRSLGVDARTAAAAAAEQQARRVGVHSVLPLMVCFLPAFLLLGVVPIIGGVAGQLVP